MKKFLLGTMALLLMQTGNGMNLNSTGNNGNSKAICYKLDDSLRRCNKYAQWVRLLTSWMNGVDNLAIATATLWNDENNVDLKTHCEQIKESFLHLVSLRSEDSFVDDEAFSTYSRLCDGNNLKNTVNQNLRSYSILLQFAISHNWFKDNVCKSIMKQMNETATLFRQGAMIFFESNLMNMLFPKVSNSELTDFLQKKGCPISEIRMFDFSHVNYPNKGQIPDDIELKLRQTFNGKYPVQAIPSGTNFKQGDENRIYYDRYKICISKESVESTVAAGISSNTITPLEQCLFSVQYHELNHAVAHPLMIFFIIYDFLCDPGISEITDTSLDVLLKMVNCSKKPATVSKRVKNISHKSAEEISKMFSDMTLENIREELYEESKADIIEEITQIEGFFVWNKQFFWYPWNDKRLNIVMKQPLRFGHILLEKANCKDWCLKAEKNSQNIFTNFIQWLFYIKPNLEEVEQLIMRESKDNVSYIFHNHPEAFAQFPDDYITIDEQFFHLLNDKSLYKTIEEEDNNND